jgi:sulfur carrier protein
MKILLNGEPIEIEQGQSLEELIRQQGLQGRRIAVEVNEELVSRGAYPACRLQDGDRVEIVVAIGGG